MDNREVEVLNEIFAIANDESFSEREALQAIVEIVEDRFSEFGMFPEGEDPNED